MRKTIILSATAIMAIAFFSSCKKDYTCTCNINGQETKSVFSNTRKPEAKLACDALKAAGADCKLD